MSDSPQLRTSPILVRALFFERGKPRPFCTLEGNWTREDEKMALIEQADAALALGFSVTIRPDPQMEFHSEIPIWRG